METKFWLILNGSRTDRTTESNLRIIPNEWGEGFISGHWLHKNLQKRNTELHIFAIP